MHLASITSPEGPRTAIVADGRYLDVAKHAPELPTRMADLLALGATAMARLHSLAAGATAWTTLDPAMLTAPVRPGKIIAIGLNYADHVAETGQETPTFPVVFAKLPSCLNGPFDDVVRPNASDQLDYEGELGIVIGTRCKHVAEEQARRHVAGYVVANDVSVRDYQMRTSQWLLGKSFDTHGVIGPWITTSESIDPHGLHLRTLVNGTVRQDSNTRHLIFDCDRLVALLSSVCTLEPGDVILTGTPGGVGFATGDYLRPGDHVRVEIEGLGHIENRVVQEPPATKFDTPS